MRDGEVVATIVAGDSRGLAEAYDRYAAPLYSYCRSQLHEPAEAAEAVQDTFVIAATRLKVLRNPDRLRPWLYAVARNECRHRIRETTPAPEAARETADPGGDAGSTELHALVRAAIGGVNRGEQEALELHGLDSSEVGDVLGVSRNHAHALLSRARDQLKASLGVLLVARTGRQDCPALSELLADWDGRLTVPRRKLVSRHIEQCPVCTVRMRREMRAVMLPGVTPVAALALEASEIPGGIKHRVLGLATADAPDAVEHRAAVGRRAGTFRPRGFPKPLDPPALRWRSRTAQAAAGVGAAAVAAAVIAIALADGTHDAGAPSAGAAAGVPSGAVGGGAGPGSHGPSAHHGASAIAVGTSSASPAAGTSASPTTEPSPSTSPSDPAPSTSAPPPSRQGTLSASPTRITLAPLSGTTITLKARKGPVRWTISEPSSVVGALTVTPSSGTLASGKSTKVTITGSVASLDTSLTANPGNVTITVLIGLG